MNREQKHLVGSSIDPLATKEMTMVEMNLETSQSNLPRSWPYKSFGSRYMHPGLEATTKASSKEVKNRYSVRHRGKNPPADYW